MPTVHSLSSSFLSSMPYAALSSAPSPLSLDDCRFLLVSETAQDSCRPLHIPLRVVHNASTVTNSEKRSDAKLVLGKCRTELYWALERVPNTMCAWKHVVVWVERLDCGNDGRAAHQNESLPRLSGHANCAAHPALPSCVVRILCVGHQAINIIRFADQSIIVVPPGQPQILKAYDCIVLGDMHAVGQNATLRFCPVFKVARSLSSTIIGVQGHNDNSCPQHGEGNSSLSSSASLVDLGPKRPLFTIPDDARSDAGGAAAVLTCTNITALIVADIVANLQVLGVGPVAPPRPTIVLRSSVDAPSHPAMLVDDESLPHHASHVSESENESSHALSAPIQATPHPPDTATLKMHNGAQPLHDVIELDPNVTVAHTRCANDGANGIGRRERRARSDSTTCTSSQQIIPPPPHKAAKHVDGCGGGSLEDINDQDVLVVPGSSSAGCRTRSPMLVHHVVTSTAASSSSSARPPGAGTSLPQESFDERWDEQLLALEAQSAAAHGAAPGSPPRLMHPLGCRARVGSGAAGVSETVLRRLDGGGGGSQVGAGGSHYQPESQMVYFGHSQE